MDIEKIQSDRAVDLLAENKKLKDLLKITNTFLLQLEAIAICGKISTTEGHIYSMRKKLEFI